MVSHGFGWRDTCAARGVTAKAIGSSDWLGAMCQKPLPKLINATSLISPTLISVAPLSKTFLKTTRTEPTETTITFRWRTQIC